MTIRLTTAFILVQFCLLTGCNDAPTRESSNSRGSANGNANNSPATPIQTSKSAPSDSANSTAKPKKFVGLYELVSLDFSSSGQSTVTWSVRSGSCFINFDEPDPQGTSRSESKFDCTVSNNSNTQSLNGAETSTLQISASGIVSNEVSDSPASGSSDSGVVIESVSKYFSNENTFIIVQKKTQGTLKFTTTQRYQRKN